MRLTFVETLAFSARWHRRHDDEGLRALQNELIENPQRGDPAASGGDNEGEAVESEARATTMSGKLDYEKMSVFEQARQGLTEAIAHARGELTLRTTTLPAPAPKMSRARVIAIRKRAGMSRGVFAAYLNVPTRTLESWEQGRRTPKAGEARLLQMADAAPREFEALVSAVGRGRRAARRRRGGNRSERQS